MFLSVTSHTAFILLAFPTTRLIPFTLHVVSSRLVTRSRVYGESLNETMNKLKLTARKTSSVVRRNPPLHYAPPEIHPAAAVLMAPFGRKRSKKAVRFGRNKIRKHGCKFFASGTLVRSVRKLLASGADTDFKLISSDGKSFDVHKMILSCQSEYFNNMFKHNLDEVMTGQCHLPEDGDTVAALVDLLYGNNMDEPKQELMETLVVVANKYMMGEVEKECARVLVDKLRAGNAAKILKLANGGAVAGFKEKIIVFIADNLVDFVAAGGFEEFADDTSVTREILRGCHDRKVKEVEKTDGDVIISDDSSGSDMDMEEKRAGSVAKCDDNQLCLGDGVL